ncbi:MAG TPA: M12 family metallo-peptidase [Ignavibacteria bacterium]|nr:M12 family metallo-peptidase [Ignavibacteria bacterium]HRF65902.1 M12 family metallo-peptidase [Ignavibacteria bacterium]HRJ04212.1 M12 family metallo-peptidase [Ignavibacteria bacterium]
MKIFFSALLLFSFLTSSVFSSSSMWQDVQPGSFNVKGTVYLAPITYRTVKLNKVELYNVLRSAPLESVVKVRNSNVVISLPMPNGSFARFNFVESPIMEPGLQAQLPATRTYLGQGIDDPHAIVRFDNTPLGFHAMILSPNGAVFIDPYSMNETDYYISYYREDYRPAVQQNFVCLTENSHEKPVYNNIVNRTGEQLRSYRLAVACTGEFTTLLGGQANAMNNVVTTVNRITGVYETDMSVRLIIIANNMSIIYTDGNTDPYTNNNGSTLLSQNQSNLDAVIGTANYDIGHVFSTGSFGGIAGLSVVCVNGQKARGATGSTSPIGDPWSIDYVAHEMGHQFSGNHTQNNTSCNANPPTAWEPGSGITIMGYAGVCSPSLANNSIPYLHGGNLFVEMIPFTQFGNGNNCPTTTNTGNNPPVLTMPTVAGFVIPISTPFSLTGSATDPDNDPLTYSWEQTNIGPQGNPNSPTGNAPIFRPFSPVTNGTRVFPKLSDIINNTQTLGERLPTYDRLLKFRMTVRDNRAGGGGISSDEVVFQATASAGPFLVTYPNTNVTIGGIQTVTWDVANTTAAPVSCANVKISLSTDGGNSFPTVLVASTANDGSESVTLPAIENSQARIKIEALGNIFFDMSNANFTITANIGINNNQNGTPVKFELAQNFPNPFNPVTILTYALPKKSAVTLKIYDALGRETATLINNEIKTEGYYNVEFDGTSLPSGIYYYRIEAGEFVDTKKMIMIK